ncbi:hypothetical protein AB0A05_26925 [Streptomyces sp. NPDC046374]|uniref:hypothetical protein n=1 Tax=Streptomyces sp. NPDC046374 TaxID=3154917 RepID=UPI00340C7D82
MTETKPMPYAADSIVNALIEHAVTWLMDHTGWTGPKPVTLDLTKLARDNQANRDRAAEAFRLLAETDIEPVGGYPGSDKHWEVICLRDGWQGHQFNSHMRRKQRHKGCHFKEMTELEAVWLRYRVIVNRCNPEGVLGRQLGYAVEEMRKALAVTDETARKTLMNAALAYVRQAKQYTEPTEPTTGFPGV